jgi:hypothetical protein
MSDEGNRFIDAAEERARQWIESGQIQTDKIELLAQDILNLASEVRAHRRTRSAILTALAGQEEWRTEGSA